MIIPILLLFTLKQRKYNFTQITPVKPKMNSWVTHTSTRHNSWILCLLLFSSCLFFLLSSSTISLYRLQKSLSACPTLCKKPREKKRPNGWKSADRTSFQKKKEKCKLSLQLSVLSFGEAILETVERSSSDLERILQRSAMIL